MGEYGAAKGPGSSCSASRLPEGPGSGCSVSRLSEGPGSGSGWSSSDMGSSLILAISKVPTGTDL